MNTPRFSLWPLQKPSPHPSPIPADMHMHTRHSHGQASVQAMYNAAVARGISIIGFSEHSPRPHEYTYPVDYQDKLEASFPLYVQEVLDLATVARQDGVTVLLGLEMDYFPGQEDHARILRDSWPFDYVTGGLHFQGTWGFDFSAADWKPMPCKKRFAVYARYFQDLTAMCATGLFHIAAHPDIIKLFSRDSFHAWLKTREAPSLIRESLTAIKDQGMLLEISSAGLRKPCEEIYPCPEIMALASTLDLPICFASDAHCTNTPAFAFDRLARYAYSFGYQKSFVVQQGETRALAFSAPRRPSSGISPEGAA